MSRALCVPPLKSHWPASVPCCWLQAAENGATLAEQGERLEAMAQRAAAATDTILTLQAELQQAQQADAAQRDQVRAECMRPAAG